MFKEGYIRTSSEEFTLSKESLGEANIHLTNNAVQKHNENYGKFEEGNILSYKEMEKYLIEKNPEKVGWVRDVMVPKMKQQVEITI
jgi:hypothetical protein